MDMPSRHDHAGHRHPQAHHHLPEAPESDSLKDPVCGMAVTARSVGVAVSAHVEAATQPLAPEVVAAAIGIPRRRPVFYTGLGSAHHRP